MHELSVATGIVEIAENVVKEHGKTRVISIHLVIGALTCVDEKALIFALEPAALGSVLEGAGVVIERPVARGRCLKCGNEYPTEGFLAQCPQCGDSETEIVQGRELYVKSIEAE